MIEKINYYAVQTEENKEFSVKKRLKAEFKAQLSDIVIPMEESIIALAGRKFLYYNRTMPDYLLVGFTDLPHNVVDRINRIKGVERIIVETRANGGSTPAKIELSEIKRILKKAPEILKFTSPVNILYGQYAGYGAKINLQADDEALVTIDNKSKPKIKIPIWYLGTEIQHGI